MIKAVFLDLDDTLLQMDTEAFTTQYFTEFAKLILAEYPHDVEAAAKLPKIVQKAIFAMMANTDPTTTNLEVFASVLEASGAPVELLSRLFEAFHANGFAALQSITAPVERSTHLVKRLSEMGITVALATAPVYALDAIRQRMRWAGFDPDSAPFVLITSVETFHFSKPNPHYYEELLARLGLEADEVIMVGDSFDQDMLPAAQAGLNTFWLHKGKSVPDGTPDNLVPDGVGTLAEFEQRVANGWLDTLIPRPRTATQLVPRMLGNMGALYGIIHSIASDEWTQHPDPNEWSPLEIVCHLRDSETRVQRPRLERIATEKNPFISQQPAPPGPNEQDLSGENGLDALEQLWRERCNTLQYINQFSEADWQRPARHSIFGPTTLLEMAHFTTRHDRLHISQLIETLQRGRTQYV
jgi:FMN phosphatase YigB (HAD superfamily)